MDGWNEGSKEGRKDRRRWDLQNYEGQKGAKWGKLGLHTKRIDGFDGSNVKRKKNWQRSGNWKRVTERQKPAIERDKNIVLVLVLFIDYCLFKQSLAALIFCQLCIYHSVCACVCLILTESKITHTHTNTCTHPQGAQATQWSISSYWCVKTIREMEQDEKSIHPTEKERKKSCSITGRKASVLAAAALYNKSKFS